MVEPNIILARIDNRLIHGQIIGGWAAVTNANLILVANDEIVNKNTEMAIMEMTSSSMGYQSRFFTIDHTINIIHNATPNQKILIICESPKDVRRLIDGGVPIKTVNIGNMHPDKGEIKLSTKVYANENEIEDLKYIKSKVDDIFIQDACNAKRESLNI